MELTKKSYLYKQYRNITHNTRLTMLFRRAQKNEKLNFIKEVSLFRNLSERNFKALCKYFKLVSFKRNDVIISKENMARAMYIVIDGSVQVHDQEYIYAALSRKQYFGEYSLIDNDKRSASVTAITDCNLYELSCDSFEKILHDIPEVARAILKELVNRLRDTNILEEKLTQRTLNIQRDKFEIMRQRDNLEEERLELLQLNKTKDKFMTIVAHDLKNPFSTIIGISELLITDFDRYDRDQIKMFLEQIHKYSGSAYSLLDNLLQWARSQTGRLKLKKGLYNIKDIVEETIELLIGVANQKEISIEHDNHSIYMDLDVNMVSTVVRNLISNALKFTPKKGKISITYAEDTDMVHVYIKDTGVGISEEDQTKLFRIDTNPTTIGTGEEKGTGLGLILCGEFVKLHQGTITVNSEEGVGSTFHFTLKK